MNRNRLRVSKTAGLWWIECPCGYVEAVNTLTHAHELATWHYHEAAAPSRLTWLRGVLAGRGAA